MCAVYGVILWYLLNPIPVDSAKIGALLGSKDESERSRAVELLLGATADEIEALFGPVILGASRRIKSQPLPIPLEHVREAARQIAEHHPAPDARAAAALSVEPKHYAELYVLEADRRTRVTLLRLSGLAGAVEENLPLARVLLEETDPKLLVEAVGARRLWISRPWHRDGFEYWPGRYCAWLPNPRGLRQKTRPLSAEERQRLETLLETTSNPALRDACSLVLCAYQSPPKWKSEKIVPADDLRVHEWGVFLDGPNRLLPAEKVIEELPTFVHRSTVTAADIRRHRFHGALVASKPVVFFYAPQPMLLDVRVSFHRGRPWTFYPDITDYVQGVKQIPRGRLAPRPTTPDPKFIDEPESAPPWVSLPRLPLRGRSPSPLRTWWSEDRLKLEAPAIPDDLRQRYSRVPWIVPGRASSPSHTSRGHQVLSHIGIEWSGLRVGFDAKLEAPLPVVATDHWWNHLRAVPSRDVAVRGERERFLFYDGAIDSRNPVTVAWSDETRRALKFRVIPFTDLLGKPPSRSRRDRERPIHPVPTVITLLVDEEGVRGAELTNLDDMNAEGYSLALAELDCQHDEAIELVRQAILRFGLTSPEAESLIETWRHEFFEAPGLRTLTLMPEWLYDHALPLEIRPQPGEIRRLGIIWKECEELSVDTPPVSHPGRLPAPSIAQLTIEAFDQQPQPWDRGELLEAGTEQELLSCYNDSTLSVRFTTSPSARRFVATWFEADARVAHWVDLDAGVRREILRCARSPQDRWVPPVRLSDDGLRVLFIANSQVTLLDLRDGSRWDLDSLNEVRESLCGISGSGTRCAYAKGSGNLHWVDLDAKRLRVLGTSHNSFNGVEAPPRLSRDGNRLTLSTRYGSRFAHLLLDVEAEKLWKLGSTRSCSSKGLPISPDGVWVLGNTRSRGHWDVLLVDTDEQVRRFLTPRGTHETAGSFVPNPLRANHPWIHVVRKGRSGEVVTPRYLFVDPKTGQTWAEPDATQWIHGFLAEGREALAWRRSPSGDLTLTVKSTTPRPR